MGPQAVALSTLLLLWMTLPVAGSVVAGTGGRVRPTTKLPIDFSTLHPYELAYLTAGPGEQPKRSWQRCWTERSYRARVIDGCGWRLSSSTLTHSSRLRRDSRVDVTVPMPASARWLAGWRVVMRWPSCGDDCVQRVR